MIVYNLKNKAKYTKGIFNYWVISMKIMVLVVFLYVAAIIDTFVFAKNIRKVEKNELSSSLIRLLSVSIITIVLYATSMVVRVKLISSIGFALYNISDLLMMFSLYRFVRIYTVLPDNEIKADKLLKIFLIIDTVLLALNTKFEFMYEVGEATNKMNYHLHVVSETKIFYFIHLIFMYCAAILVLRILLNKLLKTPSMYKRKYSVIFWEIIGLAILNLACIHFENLSDFGLILYPVIAYSIYHFSLKYVPSALIERLLFFTMSNMKDGIICLDVDGRIVRWNKMATAYCDSGTGETNNIEQQVEKWLANNVNLGDDEDSCSWKSQRRIEGKECYFTIEYMKFFDQKRNYIGCSFILHNHTDEVNKIRLEKYNASHDDLTGIYNKRRFCEKSAEVMEENKDTLYCIVCADVKGFKLINDLFDFDGGDKVLIRLAEITKKLAGEDGVFGRIGGDRFAVCMPYNKFHADTFLQEYSTAGNVIPNSQLSVHVHIGVYKAKDTDVKVSIMCDRANLAILQIKDSYRSIVSVYEKDVRDAVLKEQEIIKAFGNALATGEFHTFIQPQIDKYGYIRGGEALVRWIKPGGQIVPPGDFIDILEKTGLISRLDMYMWRMACMQIRTWISKGYENAYISVNISQKDIMILDVHSILTSLVNEFGIPTDSLHLEITETAVMEDSEKLEELINSLKISGFIVEIDDFGSGYSALNTLKTLDVDVIKLDMKFLQNKGNKLKGSIILKNIIRLAKELNMEVITEGVSCQDHVDFMLDTGADIFQGFHFSPPIPINEFEEKFLYQTVEIKHHDTTDDIAEFPYIDDISLDDDDIPQENVGFANTDEIITEIKE